MQNIWYGSSSFLPVCFLKFSFGQKQMYKEIFLAEIPSCVCCDLNDKEKYICTFIPLNNHLHNWLGKLDRALF